MTNGSHPPKKPAPPTSKKEKSPKRRKALMGIKPRSRLAVLLEGSA